MTRKRLLLGGVGALALVLTVLSVDRPAPPPAGSDPVYAEVHGLLEQAYDVTEWSVKVPVAWAAPRLLAAGLTAWVATLPLEADVRARVQARLGSDGMVDELVPFALFVKDMYDRPEVEGFDDWARANVPRDGTPGLEHSMFTFTPPAEAAESGGGGLPADQAARLLALYDAVYLQDADPGAALDQRLACEGDDAGLEARGREAPSAESSGEGGREAGRGEGPPSPRNYEARTGRAAPIVRDLLSSLATGMEPGDIKDAVGHVLADPETLDAITLTLIEFVDGEVCKHYRIFAARVQRERQLGAWLGDALTDPARADGWTWLRWHGTRRHAVHVVVDGLQGHLVEALARGEAGDPFLRRVVEEEATEAAARPKLLSTTAAPAMTTTYLKWAVERGSAGLLPFFAGLYTSPGIARHGISTTPTISVRNLPIAKTGAPVAGEGGTGIPNFHCVDRDYVRDGVTQGRPWYFYGNDALQLTQLTQQSGMRTMFERFDRLVTMSCGAQYDEQARYSFDSFLSLAVGEKSRDFGDLRCVGELRRRATNEARLRTLRGELLAREVALRATHHPWEWYDRWQQATEREAARTLVAELAALEPVGMPDYLLYYNPWPDHFAHGKGPFADEIVSPTGELRRLDHWLGQLSDAYTSADVDERTVWGMAGDHGLSTVRWIVSPEAEVIGGLEKAGVKLVVRKISSDEGEGPKLTHRLRPPSMRDIDVVVASTAGGNYMMDFFVDQGANWGRQPVLAELRVLRTLGGKTIDVVSEIRTRLGDTLDYLVVREAPCGVDGGITAVIAARGSGTIERRGARVWYGWDGADPLGLDVISPYERFDDAVLAQAASERVRCVAADRAAPSTWCTEDEWRALTRVNKRIDAVTQLAHLYDTDRAGTINLFPRDGVGYNTKVPGRHAGESFHEKDAFVGVWGAPVGDGERVEAAVNGAVPMALHAWLTGEAATQGEDGWGYSGLDLAWR